MCIRDRTGGRPPAGRGHRRAEGAGRPVAPRRPLSGGPGGGPARRPVRRRRDHAGRNRVRRAPTAVAPLRDGRRPRTPHNLRITGDEEDVGWQLCDMAPLTALDLQRLLATEGLMTRMQLLTELCDAMAEDVTGMLADGSSR